MWANEHQLKSGDSPKNMWISFTVNILLTWYHGRNVCLIVIGSMPLHTEGEFQKIRWARCLCLGQKWVLWILSNLVMSCPFQRTIEDSTLGYIMSHAWQKWWGCCRALRSWNLIYHWTTFISSLVRLWYLNVKLISRDTTRTCSEQRNVGPCEYLKC